ncbi:FUSC family protein, partial [uncultured Methanobrevibacter sp.]|uniref:FUSC family protein n=1 Tax=uncultured Methanobrevibacter sp. TaxID=253161 RepID=UPI0025D42B09
MNNALKSKIIMFASMMLFMIFYMVLFGSKNAVIGMMVVMAAFMNLSNDLSFKAKSSFIKILLLLLVLGIASFLNNPLTIFGCILTFVVVFATTFTSYNLFGTHVYLPYLMIYFMMVGIPVSVEMLPMRLLSLVFGAVFIVGLNMTINREKDYKLSKATIDILISELDKAIDLKLDGKDVFSDNFRTINGFYLSILNRSEYKYFPSEIHKSVLNVVKSFQYIGKIISEYDLSNKELLYIRSVLSQIKHIDLEDIFEGIEIDSKVMYLVLLNLEIISNEIRKDLTDEILLPDKNTLKTQFKSLIRQYFSFRSVKFTFAFKMAFLMFVWQLLTLMFNLPFTKWLYFATISLMLPYINDVAYSAKSRLQGTFIGVFVFAAILIIVPYLNVSFNVIAVAVMVVCMFIMVIKLEDKLILTIVTTVISVMTALMYIPPPEAMELKILWVIVAVVVVTLFNYKFLPYSVEIETKNNLKTSYILNQQSIDLVKQKCMATGPDKKTTLLVLSNVVRENIEITEENRELYNLQVKITDICNFILNYLDLIPISDDLAKNLVEIIDGNALADVNLNIKDKILAYSMEHVMSLFKDEQRIIEGF